MKSEKDKDLTEEEKDIKAEVESVVGEKLEEDELLAKYGAGTSSAMYPRGVSSFNRSISPFASVEVSKAMRAGTPPSNLQRWVGGKLGAAVKKPPEDATVRESLPGYSAPKKSVLPPPDKPPVRKKGPSKAEASRIKRRGTPLEARDKERAELLGEPEPEVADVKSGTGDKKKASERVQISSLGGGAPQEIASPALKDKKLHKLINQKLLSKTYYLRVQE